MRGLLITCSLLAPLGCQRDAATSDTAAPEEVPDDVLATVLGKDLTVDDLEEPLGDSMNSFILGALLDRFCEEKGIVATEEDVQNFMDCVSSGTDLPVEQGTLPEEDVGDVGPELTNQAARVFVEQMVVSWKTSKALYERYGGTVIFQQSNPMEPVGAYLAFVEEHEKKGSFKIHDSEMEAQFWSYFTVDHGPWVVDPGEVDYSVPWWETAGNE